MEIVRTGNPDEILATAPGASVLNITALKPAVKNQQRVNVFINQRYAFSLDLAQVVDYGVKVGQTLTPERLAELQHASDFGKLYQRTLEYVLTRPHSTQEVQDYLKRKQIQRRIDTKRYEGWRQKLQSDPALKAKLRTDRQAGRKSYHPTKPGAEISDQDIIDVMTRLTERGYLDDRNFARYFVENRFVKKGVSTKRLRQELAQKGINQSIIEEVLASDISRDDAAEIQKIIAKKRRLKTYAQDDAKLIQYLVRQGFSYELARDSLRETD